MKMRGMLSLACGVHKMRKVTRYVVQSGKHTHTEHMNIVLMWVCAAYTKALFCIISRTCLSVRTCVRACVSVCEIDFVEANKKY